MTTDQLIYLVLGGAGLGIFCAAVVNGFTTGWGKSLGLSLPPFPLPPGPLAPPTEKVSEDGESTADTEAKANAEADRQLTEHKAMHQRIRDEQHRHVAAKQARLKEKARNTPRPHS